jgi:hypothetical protein
MSGPVRGRVYREGSGETTIARPRGAGASSSRRVIRWRLNRREFLRAAGRAAAATGALLGISCEEPDEKLPFRRIFADDFPGDGAGLGDEWLSVRYGATARRAAGNATVRVHPAPAWVVGERARTEYLGETFVVPTLRLSSCKVSARVRLSGPSEAGVIACWNYDEAYAVLLTPEEVLLCRYGVMDRTVLDRSPVPKKGWWAVELSVSGPRLRARAVHGDAHHKLSAEDPDPLPGGLAGIVVNPSDPKREADAHFRGFRVASSDEAQPPAPAFAYQFTGAVVPDGAGGYRARVTARTVLPRAVSFEISQDPELSDPAVAGPVAPKGRLGAAHAWLGGLEPTRTYYWRPVVRGEDKVVRGRTALFRTPPGAGAGSRFVFGSCTSGRIDSYPSFATAASLRPDFYLHAGDWGYASQTSLDRRADHFQARWIRLLRAPHVQRFLDETPLLFWQDDHDYGADNGWSETVKDWAVSAFDELHANPSMEFFDLRWGDAHIFCLDCRLYASDPKAADDARKTRLGSAQKRWLRTQLLASDAPVIVIASPMAFRNKVHDDPGWHSVYTHERVELLELFSSLDATVVILSGDSHGHRLIHHFEYGELYEITASGTDFPEGDGWAQGNNDPEHTLVNVTDRTGFVLVELDPATPSRRLTVRSISSADGSSLFERSFPVQS